MMPSHAYVGYAADGTPVLVALDNNGEDLAEICAAHILSGGYLERVTLEQARAVKLYERKS